jgi:myo-inositol-1(or 4)-monophosphatase
MDNYGELCQKVCEINRNAGKFLQSEVSKIRNTDIESKGLNDFVTYVDKTSEQILVKALSKLLPDAGFIAEENTSDKKGEIYNWIIDPLDGTTNFIHGLPCYSISIALKEKDKIVLGVVYEINQDECFYAWEGSNAFLNNKIIKVSSVSLIKDSLLATGFPYYDYSKLAPYMEMFTYFLKNTHGLRRMGSAAVDLVYVACGRFEGFYEYGLRPWDVAAGAIIVQQAGGKVSDFRGGNDYLFGKELIATNATIFKEFIELTQTYFK